MHFLTDEMYFELFCIKNDFAKYFEKYRNLFIQIFCFTNYDNSSKMILFYAAGQIKFPCVA